MKMYAIIAQKIRKETFVRYSGKVWMDMEVLYNSTRSNGTKVKASEAILKGLSDDGGLFVPDHIPALDKSLKELAGMTYQEVAYEVMIFLLRNGWIWT